jgi:hypothetical protein
MSNTRSSELGRETGEHRLEERRLETLDDIPREIADRRLHAEFSEFISPEQSEILRKRQDRIEKPEDFKQSAKNAGLDHAESVLGWSTKLEAPAHVLKNEVPKEIATLVHEDLHRLTDETTVKELTSSQPLIELYEGLTEYFTEKAVTGLHKHQSGECYPDEVRQAGDLVNEVGETKVREFFFKHEMHEDVLGAIQRLSDRNASA